MKKKILMTFAGLISVFCVFAQKEADTIELNEVQVEAKRAKIYPDEARMVKIIEKSEIEKLPVQTLDELLDRVAGLDARQRGTNGVQTDLSVRGGTFDQVLILLNGINITDPQTGHYNLDVPVELSDISRVEILQGSAARVYGPNAFSGAINIITSETRANQVSSKSEAGSYGAIAQNISGNYYSDTFQTFASAAYKRSDGFIKNTDYNTVNAFLQSKINTQKAGYFRFQLGTQFKKFGANSFYTPKLPHQFEDTKTFFSSLEWNLEKDFYALNAQMYRREHFDKFIFNRYAPVIAANYHQTSITGGKFSAGFDWKTYGKTTVGADLRNEHIFSNNLGTILENRIRVPFEKDTVYYTKSANRLLLTSMIDHSINIDKWNFSGGFSSTFNKQFGTSANGGIDVAYKPNNASRIFTALNTAVRFPTFTDLYYSDSSKKGNPDLQPEKSTTVELGGKSAFGRLKIDATVYYRWGKNIIDWVRTNGSEKYQSKNLTHVNAAGADLNAEYQFNSTFWKSVRAGYSFLNLDKKADGFESLYALDYLKNKVVFGLDHKIWKQLSANWNLSWFDRAGNYTDFQTQQIVNYKPYTLLNSRLLWNSKHVGIHFDVNNILNQKYVEFGGLAQPGINFTSGISLKI